MNPTTAISPADRTRAVDRLRSLTLRTALAGIAAVGGFGYLAAQTYTGDKTATTTAVTSTPAPAPTDDNSSSGGDSATATPSPTLRPATPAPATSTARAHATTGGSG